MTRSRRNFLQAGTFALGGALFSGAANPLHAAAVISLKPELTANDRKVIAFLRNFSNRIILQGGCVAAKIDGNHGITHLVAEVTSLEHFGSCLLDESEKLFGTCHMAGNTLTFKLGDSEFSIDNLVPELFSDRIRQLQLSTNGDIHCPHEALQFDSDSGALADPFGVLTETDVSRLVREPYTRIIRKVRRMKNGRRRVRRIRRNAHRLVQKTTPGVEASLSLFPADQSPADAFTTLTGALVDKVQFGLIPDESFANDKNRILDQGVPLDTEQSRQICREFIRAVSSLAGDTEAIKNLIGSPLLSGCLAEIFGIDAADIVANFDRLRSASHPSYTDGAIWLALLLFDEIRRGHSFPWVDQIERLRFLRANTDLKQASAAYLD